MSVETRVRALTTVSLDQEQAFELFTGEVKSKFDSSPSNQEPASRSSTTDSTNSEWITVFGMVRNKKRSSDRWAYGGATYWSRLAWLSA